MGCDGLIIQRPSDVIDSDRDADVYNLEGFGCALSSRTTCTEVLRSIRWRGNRSSDTDSIVGFYFVLALFGAAVLLLGVTPAWAGRRRWRALPEHADVAPSSRSAGVPPRVQAGVGLAFVWAFIELTFWVPAGFFPAYYFAAEVSVLAALPVVLLMLSGATLSIATWVAGFQLARCNLRWTDFSLWISDWHIAHHIAAAMLVVALAFTDIGWNALWMMLLGPLPGLAIVWPWRLAVKRVRQAWPGTKNHQVTARPPL